VPACCDFLLPRFFRLLTPEPEPPDLGRGNNAEAVSRHHQNIERGLALFFPVGRGRHVMRLVGREHGGGNNVVPFSEIEAYCELAGCFSRPERY